MSEQNDKGEIPAQIELEFSRPVDVTTIAAKGRHYRFQATDEEKSALAQRFSVESLDVLEIGCAITPTKKGQFRLDATFKADVVQLCCVSLKPVEEKISGEFTMLLRQAGRRQAETVEVDFDLEPEDIEFLSSNLLDVGEVIAQYLSVEINPYPRHHSATGKELGQKIIQEEDWDTDSDKARPFDVLQSLKHKT